MIRKAINFMFPPELDLLHDEGGFLKALMEIGQLAAPFLGSLFGGAPDVSDLPQGLQDVSQLTRDALTQAQNLRGDLVQDAHILKDLSTENRRSIGAFDPTSLGGDFGFLGDTVGQFSDVDRSEQPLREMIANIMNVANMAQSVGQHAPSTELGIAQLLGNAGQSAGGGLGSAIGNTLGMLGTQQQTGTGLFAPGAFGGEQQLNVMPTNGPDLSSITGVTMPETGAGAGFSQASPLVQMLMRAIIEGIK